MKYEGKRKSKSPKQWCVSKAEKILNLSVRETRENCMKQHTKQVYGKTRENNKKRVLTKKNTLLSKKSPKNKTVKEK